MSKENSFTLSFNNIRAADLPLVGGKGANLGELTHAGFPIPPGFCVTTIAFQEFMDASAKSADLYDLLETIGPDDVEKTREAGRSVRETLLDVPMPSAIVQALAEEWHNVGSEHAYAVRSSATAEDLPDASFAGQQDTYLNVVGEADLLDAVRRCWASLFTDRAILYRTKNHFPHRDVKLSVVVQQMIMSEISGILFTADPLTGHRHTLAIDASFGLGEALVSGIVSPDTYRVDKRNFTIVDRQIADKEIAIYPQKDGGTREVRLSSDQRTKTVLTDSQILTLADLGTRVESYYGSPQDIEWAVADNNFYLLQARPITSLYPVDGLQSPDDSLHIYFSAGHQQMMTNAMSPLGLSTMQNIIPIGRTSDGRENSVLRADGGRLFGDITSPLRHPIGRKVVTGVLSQFDALAPEAIQLAMKRPEFQGPSGISISFPLLKGLTKTFYRVLAALFWQNLDGTVDKTNQIIARYVDEARTTLEALPPGEEKVKASIQALRSMAPVVLNWAPQFAAGEIAHRLLGRLVGERVDPADLEAYRLGLPGNVVMEMNLAVGDLADLARQSPQLRTSFDDLSMGSQAWLAQASELEDSGPFFQAWNAFMTQYGVRGSAEIDIKTPRWIEEPLPLLQVVAGYLQKDEGSHRDQHQQLVQEQKATVNRILSSANQGLLGGSRARLARRLIYVVHKGSVLREHHKYMAVQVICLAKVTVKETAVFLADAQRLSHTDDVWYLSWPELLDLTRGNDLDVVEQIPGRRTDLVRFQEMTPPLIITSDGEAPAVRYSVEDAPEGALVGNPVSAGIVEGPVRVIRDPQTATLRSGEILVAPFTDPGWTPLFINAGGLIMEVGGIMNHGSVVAREYGIPAVVGVREATKTLHTGQWVRVDGNRGIVEIVQPGHTL